MTTFPRDVDGTPIPCEVIDRPLVRNGVDSFIVQVKHPRQTWIECWPFTAIRQFAADGQPISLAERR